VVTERGPCVVLDHCLCGSGWRSVRGTREEGVSYCIAVRDCYLNSWSIAVRAWK
jgi:hypothetical protein